MLSVVKTFKFHAAHFLPNHEGLCRNLHGHTYKLKVEVRSALPNYLEKKDSGPEMGMVVDFSILKKVVEENVLRELDHSNLNNIYTNPTAENMVSDIWARLEHSLYSVNVFLVSLELYETESSCARKTNG